MLVERPVPYTHDLAAVAEISDRIMVMEGGRISGELDGARASEEDVLRLALPAREGGAWAPEAESREVAAP